MRWQQAPSDTVAGAAAARGTEWRRSRGPALKPQAAKFTPGSYSVPVRVLVWLQPRVRWLSECTVHWWPGVCRGVVRADVSEPATLGSPLEIG